MSEKRLSGDIDKKLDQYLSAAMEKAEKKFGEFATNLLSQEQQIEKTMETVAKKNTTATKKLGQSIAKDGEELEKMIDKAFSGLNEKMSGKLSVFGNKEYSKQEKVLDERAERLKKTIKNHIKSIQEVYDSAKKFNVNDTFNDLESSKWLRGFLPDSKEITQSTKEIVNALKNQGLEVEKELKDQIKHRQKLFLGYSQMKENIDLSKITNKDSLEQYQKMYKAAAYLSHIEDELRGKIRERAKIYDKEIEIPFKGTFKMKELDTIVENIKGKVKNLTSETELQNLFGDDVFQLLEDRQALADKAIKSQGKETIEIAKKTITVIKEEKDEMLALHKAIDTTSKSLDKMGKVSSNFRRKWNTLSTTDGKLNGAASKADFALNMANILQNGDISSLKYKDETDKDFETRRKIVMEKYNQILEEYSDVKNAVEAIMSGKAISVPKEISNPVVVDSDEFEKIKEKADKANGSVNNLKTNLKELADQQRNEGNVNDFDGKDWKYSKDSIERYAEGIKNLKEQISQTTDAKLLDDLNRELEDAKISFIALYDTVNDYFDGKLNKNRSIKAEIRNLYSSLIGEEAQFDTHFSERVTPSVSTPQPNPTQIVDKTERLKELVNKTTINFEELKEILSSLPDDKIKSIATALEMAMKVDVDAWKMFVEKSEMGKYFTFEGTRSGAKFFLNNDGEFTRKPNKNKVSFTEDRKYLGKDIEYNDSRIASLIFDLRNNLMKASTNSTSLPSSGTSQEIENQNQLQKELEDSIKLVEGLERSLNLIVNGTNENSSSDFLKAQIESLKSFEENLINVEERIKSLNLDNSLKSGVLGNISELKSNFATNIETLNDWMNKAIAPSTPTNLHTEALSVEELTEAYLELCEVQEKINILRERYPREDVEWYEGNVIKKDDFTQKGSLASVLKNYLKNDQVKEILRDANDNIKELNQIIEEYERAYHANFWSEYFNDKSFEDRLKFLEDIAIGKKQGNQNYKELQSVDYFGYIEAELLDGTIKRLTSVDFDIGDIFQTYESNLKGNISSLKYVLESNIEDLRYTVEYKLADFGNNIGYVLDDVQDIINDKLLTLFKTDIGLKVFENLDYKGGYAVPIDDFVEGMDYYGLIEQAEETWRQTEEFKTYYEKYKSLINEIYDWNDQNVIADKDTWKPVLKNTDNLEESIAVMKSYQEQLRELINNNTMHRVLYYEESSNITKDFTYLDELIERTKTLQEQMKVEPPSLSLTEESSGQKAVKLFDEYGQKIKEVNAELLKGTKLIEEQNQGIIKLYHNSNEIFESFSLSNAGKNQGLSQGMGTYLATNPRDYNDAAYGIFQTEWYAKVTKPLIKNVISRMGGELFKAFSEDEIIKIFKEYYGTEHPGNEDYLREKFSRSVSINDGLEVAAKQKGQTMNDVLQFLGYDSIIDGTQVIIFDPKNVVRANDIIKSLDGVELSLDEATQKSNELKNVTSQIIEKYDELNNHKLDENSQKKDFEQHISMLKEIIPLMEEYSTLTNGRNRLSYTDSNNKRNNVRLDDLQNSIGNFEQVMNNRFPEIEQTAHETERLAQKEQKASEEAQNFAKTIAESFGVKSKSVIERLGFEIDDVLAKLREANSAGMSGDEFDIFMSTPPNYHSILDILAEDANVAKTAIGSAYDEYDKLREYVSNSKIHNSPIFASELGDDYHKIRNVIGSTVLVNKGGTDIVTYLEELNSALGHTIDITGIAQNDLRQLYEVLNNGKQERLSFISDTLAADGSLEYIQSIIEANNQEAESNERVIESEQKKRKLRIANKDWLEKHPKIKNPIQGKADSSSSATVTIVEKEQEQAKAVEETTHAIETQTEAIENNTKAKEKNNKSKSKGYDFLENSTFASEDVINKLQEVINNSENIPKDNAKISVTSSADGTITGGSITYVDDALKRTVTEVYSLKKLTDEMAVATDDVMEAEQALVLLYTKATDDGIARAKQEEKAREKEKKDLDEIYAKQLKYQGEIDRVKREALEHATRPIRTEGRIGEVNTAHSNVTNKINEYLGDGVVSVSKAAIAEIETAINDYKALVNRLQSKDNVPTMATTDFENKKAQSIADIEGLIADLKKAGDYTSDLQKKAEDLWIKLNEVGSGDELLPLAKSIGTISREFNSLKKYHDLAIQKQKEIQSQYDQSIQIIKQLEVETDKLNNMMASDLGKGKKSNQIEDQLNKTVEAANNAKKAIEDVDQMFAQGKINKGQQREAGNAYREARQGSTASQARYEDAKASEEKAQAAKNEKAAVDNLKESLKNLISAYTQLTSVSVKPGENSFANALEQVNRARTNFANMYASAQNAGVNDDQLLDIQQNSIVELTERVSQAGAKAFDSYINKIEETKSKLKSLGQLSPDALKEFNELIQRLYNANFNKDLSSFDGIQKYIQDIAKYSSIVDEEVQRISQGSKIGSFEAQIAEFDQMNVKSVRFISLLTQVKQRLKEFNDFKAQTSDKQLISDREFQLIKQLSPMINDLYKEAQGKGTLIPETIGQVTNVQQLEEAMQNYAKTLGYTRRVGKTVAQENGQLTISFKNGEGQILKMTGSVDALNKGLRQTSVVSNQAVGFITNLKASFKQMIGYFTRYYTGYMLITRVISYFKEGISIVKEFDAAMTELQKVSNDSAEALKKFEKQSFEIAETIGSTGKEIVNSAADWEKLGYAIEDASELARNAALYSNVGDMDIDTATEHMVSTLKAFEEFDAQSSQLIVDKFNEIGNNYAITSEGIGAALERSASTLVAANNDLDQAIALITAGNIITQDPESVGNAIKVVSMRLRGAKAELEKTGEETEGLITSTSKLQEKIMALTGVDIMIDDSTFKSTYEILLEISKVWDELSDVNRASVLEVIAGKTRGSVVAGLLQQGDTLESVYQDSQKAEGSALEENERYLESIQGHLDKLSNQWQKIWTSEVTRETMNWFVDKLTGLLKIVEKLGLGLSTVIGAGTIIGGKALIKTISSSGGRVKQNKYIKVNPRIKYATEQVS